MSDRRDYLVPNSGRISRFKIDRLVFVLFLFTIVSRYFWKRKWMTDRTPRRRKKVNTDDKWLIDNNTGCQQFLFWWCWVGWFLTGGTGWVQLVGAGFTHMTNNEFQFEFLWFDLTFLFSSNDKYTKIFAQLLLSFHTWLRLQTATHTTSLPGRTNE